MKKKLISFVIVAMIAIIVGSFTLKAIYPLKYYGVISEACASYDIDPLFVLSVLKAESNFNENATSHKNAAGLMQIMEQTAVEFAEKLDIADFTPADIYDPQINITIGTAYLDYLLGHFGGDKTVVLAAYNAGMGRVGEWLDNENYSPDGKTLTNVPYGETSRYITKVLNNYRIYTFIY